MNCMKCGREIAPGQVFCDSCREEMEKYPVAPGTPVQLPRRTETAPKKAPKRRVIPLEEQVKTLKSRVRLLTVLLGITTLLVLALAYPAVQYLMEDHFKVGQNYSSVTSTTPPTISAATAD